MARGEVKSLRVDPALWARVEARALAEGVSAGALVVRFIGQCLGGEAQPAPVVEREKPAPRAKAEKSVPAPKVTAKAESQAQASEPARDAGELTERQRVIRGLGEAPGRPAYGSMLKGQPKAKAARRG